MINVRTHILRTGGAVVAMGGLFMLLINAVLTPLLPVDAPFGELAASRIFAWRQSLAVIAALLLTLGSVPLHLGQVDRSRIPGTITFLVAFVGGAFLLAHEWNQVFFVRDLALHLPASLEALEDVPGLTLFDFSALIAVSTFTLGWLTFAVSMLASRVYRKSGPLLLIAGFFLVPLLGAVLPHPWGQMMGSIVLGLGWLVLGGNLWQLANGQEERRSARSPNAGD